jgi:deoxyribose-phosphate aldolase
MINNTEIKDILAKVDHTLLAQDATWEQIKSIVDDGIKYQTASVCIPASFVKQAAAYADGKVAICTVIGFPNGYSTTAAKTYEAWDAVNNGADEVDMVVNIGWIKDEKYSDILNEINSVKKSCNGKILKVIIETCLLTDGEKIKMCEIVSQSGADFIKTSTGFSKSGASFDDIRLMREHCGSATKIKAAGGISSLEDAEKFIELGADRLGTSRIVKIMKGMENDGTY